MKDLIVIIGMILLGCLIFNWIAGDEDSLKDAAGSWFERAAEAYQEL